MESPPPRPGSAPPSSTRAGRQRCWEALCSLHGQPTVLSRKHGTSGVFKPQPFVLVAGAGRLLHRKVIFKARHERCALGKGLLSSPPLAGAVKSQC